MEIKYNKLIQDNSMIAIVGPTGSGKTGVSIALSKLMNIEIISADSRQIYKYLNIGTATPTDDELKAVKTHFVNKLNPDEYYSAGKFGDEAETIALQILENKKIPVVVGGTGLYIQSLCEGFFEDDIDESNRQKVLLSLEKKLHNEGIDQLYDKLKIIDGRSAEKYNDKNPRRILRALEYYELTGTPFSEAHNKFSKIRNFKVYYFGIDLPREILYHRINKRVEIMWNNGLANEVKEILSMGYSPELNSLNTVGYKETIGFISGQFAELQAIEKIKQNTRRYAKRQMTWFRKNKNIRWLAGTEAEIAEQIFQIIHN